MYRNYVLSMFVGTLCTVGCTNAHEAAPTHGEVDAGSPSPASIRPVGWALNVRVDQHGLALSPDPTLEPAISVGWGHALGVSAGNVALTRSGSERIEADLGWAHATVRDSSQGVEQSWRFDARPTVPVLDIRVPTQGLLFLGTSAEGGLTFRTVSQSYLTYSPATWVDASGRRTAISVRFDQGDIKMLVPREVLDASTYPAVLDPIIGSTYTLAPTQLTTPWQHQQFPAIALGTTTRLVVWSDDRITGAPGVYGTFRDDSGASLRERAGFLIGRGRSSGTPLHPSIAFAGSTYLVSWTSSNGVYAVRVTEAGSVLDNPPIVVSLGGAPNTARVDTDGTNFLVAWLDTGASPGIRSRAITQAGSLVGGATNVVLDQASLYRGLALRYAPSGDFWAVFADNRDGDFDVRAIRVTPSGAPIDAPAIDLATSFADQTYPDVAFDGAGGGMIVYEDSATLAVHGTAITTTTGTVTLGVAARISGGSDEWSPAVLRDGSAYRVGWISNAPGAASPQVARIVGPERMDGVTLGGGVTNSLALGRQSSGTIHAVWATNDALSFGYDIFRATSSGGTSSWSTPPILVSAAAHEQHSPLAAHDYNRFLAVWVQPTTGGERVYAARVSGLGEFQDTNPIALSSEALEIVLSGVYSDGLDFRVLWHEKDVRTVGGGALLTTWARRLGSVGDDGSAGTAFTCGPTSYEVSPIDIWLDSTRRYRVTLIDGDVIYNETIGGSYCSGAGGFLAESPSIVDARAMVATSSNVYFLSSVGDLYRVPQTTDIVGSTAVRVPSLPTDMETLDLVPWLGEALVYSIVRPAYPPSQDVGALMMSAGGAVEWHRVVAQNVPANAQPRGSYSGDGLFLVWAAASNAIVGRRLTWDGEFVDGSPAVLASGSATREMGDVDTEFSRRALVVHAARTEDTQFVSRIHTQVVDFRFNDGQPNGVGCVTGFDCTSGLCIDAVCCSSACGYSDPSDCQACSIAAGAPADGACAAVSAAVTCRPAAGECDIAETCDGVGTLCPADVLRALDSACGAAASGACDLPDRCTGTSPLCQTRALSPAGTLCRAAAGDCDADDRCNGVTDQCPDERRPAGASCRASGGVCDAGEVCDGMNTECPPDVRLVAGTVCRPGVGACDVEELCDGAALDCGPDVVLGNTETCRATAGSCDMPELCDGVTGVCPTDEFVFRGGVCRAARGLCDRAETCSGASAECPADELSREVCRASAGVCDPAELCDGSSDDCPVDSRSSSEVQCRAAASECDVAEFCAGDTTCPLDGRTGDGAPCGAGLVCAPGVCTAGVCVVEPLTCAAGASCSEEDGGCVAPAARGCSCGVLTDPRTEGTGFPWFIGMLVMSQALRGRRRRTHRHG